MPNLGIQRGQFRRFLIGRFRLCNLIPLRVIPAAVSPEQTLITGIRRNRRQQFSNLLHIRSAGGVLEKIPQDRAVERKSLAVIRENLLGPFQLRSRV